MLASNLGTALARCPAYSELESQASASLCHLLATQYQVSRRISLRSYQPTQLEETGAGLLDKMNIPHTVGAIDGKHVAMKRTPYAGIGYF